MFGPDGKHHVVAGYVSLRGAGHGNNHFAGHNHHQYIVRGVVRGHTLAGNEALAEHAVAVALQ